MLERASEDPECRHPQGPSHLLNSLSLGELHIPIHSHVKRATGNRARHPVAVAMSVVDDI